MKSEKVYSGLRSAADIATADDAANACCERVINEQNRNAAHTNLLNEDLSIERRHGWMDGWMDGHNAPSHRFRNDVL